MRYLAGSYWRHLDLYRNPDADFGGLLRGACGGSYEEPVDGVTVAGTLGLGAGRAPGGIDPRSLEFYRALRGMTPRLASDPSIFAHMNHTSLHRYGLERWGIPDDGERARRAVYVHWLTPGRDLSAISTQNTSGTAWWAAHTAMAAAEASGGGFTAEDVMARFASGAEYYYRTTEWELLHSRPVLAACVGQLLRRPGMTVAQYRRMLHSLNLEAGSRLLDALGAGELRELAGAAASAATGEGGG